MKKNILRCLLIVCMLGIIYLILWLFGVAPLYYCDDEMGQAGNPPIRTCVWSIGAPIMYVTN
jgi:hypothetical protein